MSEIKFRVWDSRRKKYLDKLEDIRMNIKTGDLHGKFSDGNVAEWVLEQFTGLKDKNGKEIFEGDIVVFANDYISLDDDEGNGISLKQAYELEYEGVQKSIVKKWGIITGDFDDWNEWTIMFAIDSDYIFEVIGNKFENTELLEEQCKK